MVLRGAEKYGNLGKNRKSRGFLPFYLYLMVGTRSCLGKQKEPGIGVNKNSGERGGALQESPWKAEMGRFFIG